jgi:ABC transporter substrate binding protein (PQQ-dependent alcohol dehydrogenase system)
MLSSATTTKRLLAVTGLLLSILAWSGSVMADDAEIITMGYLGLERDPAKEPVSLLDTALDDDGVQGARMGIGDNNATGRFTGQNFELVEVILRRDGEVGAGLEQLLEQGAEWIISALPKDRLLQLLDHPAAQELVIFNAMAPDDELRGEACRANLFHTTPSRRMLSDALAQFLSFKRWNRWALVFGNTDEDRLRAEALREAARRFGHTIVSEKMWPHTPLARRAEGGFHAIQREIPVFVQDFDEHHVLVIADETDYFGEFFPFQTWLPRPVVGTQGLIATAWHRAHESWGAVQLHRRLERQAERAMTPLDFAAYIAVRSLGEAATRTRSIEKQTLIDYMLSENFELGVYLGDPVSYRTWNHQLRQPILISGPRMIASVSPQEGFLHPHTPMDSLGSDEPESRCSF